VSIIIATIDITIIVGGSQSKSPRIPKDQKAPLSESLGRDEDKAWNANNIASYRSSIAPGKR
jgi:hypothetical protein